MPLTIAQRQKEWRKRTLKARYKISLEEYATLYKQQKGCCAICERHRYNFYRRLAVDHNHKTGQVRGLLCGHCNSILGFFKDNPVVILRMVRYLKGKI